MRQEAPSGKVGQQKIINVSFLKFESNLVGERTNTYTRTPSNIIPEPGFPKKLHYSQGENYFHSSCAGGEEDPNQNLECLPGSSPFLCFIQLFFPYWKNLYPLHSQLEKNFHAVGDPYNTGSPVS